MIDNMDKMKASWKCFFATHLGFRKPFPKIFSRDAIENTYRVICPKKKTLLTKMEGGQHPGGSRGGGGVISF